MNINSSEQTLKRVQISLGHDPSCEVAHHLELSAWAILPGSTRFC